MASFLLKRVAALVPVLLGIAIVTFSLTLLIPGDPVALVLGDGASSDAVAAMRERLNLDGSIFERFGTWLAGVLQGDFGTSISTGQPVADIMRDAIAKTAELALAAFLIAVVFGITLGLLMAVFTGRPARALNLFAVSGMSVPSFWLGLLLLYVFALELRLFPTGGVGPQGSAGDLVEHLRYLALPAVAVAVLPTAFIARLTRTLILELLHQDFVLTLRTRGYSNWRVWRHVLRNAAPGVVNIVGLQAGDLILGALFVEIVFTWPGIGTTMLRAIDTRDYPVIQGLVLATGAAFAVVTIATDAAMRALDPRVES